MKLKTLSLIAALALSAGAVSMQTASANEPVIYKGTSVGGEIEKRPHVIWSSSHKVFKSVFVGEDGPFGCPAYGKCR